MQRILRYLAWLTAKFCLRIVGLLLLLSSLIFDLLAGLVPGYILYANGIHMLIALHLIVFVLMLLFFHLFITSPHIYPVIKRAADALEHIISDVDAEQYAAYVKQK